jgi:glycosyltransferase involved in cell wall biosynthesis
MTTFIDFRYSRALAAALFAGQEKEEVEIHFPHDSDTYIALDISQAADICLATFTMRDGEVAATLSQQGHFTVTLRNGQSEDFITLPHHDGNPSILCIKAGPQGVGIKSSSGAAEAPFTIEGDTELRCGAGVRVLGRGTGRAARWGELYYNRGNPAGLCVELTMDWHHLRAGIPLFSTMTAEELVADGRFRLRFRSYAYEAADAESTDFVRLFGTSDAPDVAVHLTPALYDPRVPGIPNLGFGVIESDRIHPHLVARCNRMDRVCVPSAYTRDTFIRNGVTRPIDVILHGVDTDYFKPVGTKVPLPGGRSFNFLAVGTHVERKNIKHIVRAFLEEFRDRDDAALFLLLRPEYHTTQNNVAIEFTEWERKWASDSAPIFLWTGYLTREHLRNFYANANAYVMPSNEGFGLTLLEAMASGTPSIALNHGGVVDFVNDENGMLVPVGASYVAKDIDTLPYVGDVFHEPDVVSLRSAMRRLFEDRELTERLGLRARADAEKLTWPVVTRDLARVIEQTHLEYHERSSRGGASPRSGLDSPTLTLVLCVLDDANARKSLDYLRSMAGDRIRVLCLFTRYARLDDVMRARGYGFVYYRWDGTLENAKVIARSIVGRSWIAVLKPGEKLSGALPAAIDFLEAQAPDIAEVSVALQSGMRESRLFHLRPQGEPSEKTEYSGLVIR